MAEGGGLPCRLFLVLALRYDRHSLFASESIIWKLVARFDSENQDLEWSNLRGTRQGCASI